MTAGQRLVVLRLDGAECTLTDSARNALMRIAQRIGAGFDGEITLAITRQGGVRYIRWVETETGDVIRERVL